MAIRRTIRDEQYRKGLAELKLVDAAEALPRVLDQALEHVLAVEVTATYARWPGCWLVARVPETMGLFVAGVLRIGSFERAAERSEVRGPN